jgi:hypothetical protein
MKSREKDPRRNHIRHRAFSKTFNNLGFEDIFQPLSTGAEYIIPEKIINILGLDRTIWKGKITKGAIFMAGKRTGMPTNKDVSVTIKIEQEKRDRKKAQLEIRGITKEDRLVIYKAPIKVR